MKEDMAKRDRGRRPFIASECKNLSDCEYWRRGILKEITRLVADIQNAGLGEHMLRDMNDTINKKIREKRHWERQILRLGGPNYLGKDAMIDADGREVGGGGYKYFGATKNLPGVRELFEPVKKKKKKRTRHEIYCGITPDYYGYRDDDDGVLAIVEAEAEKIAIAKALEEYNSRKRQRRERQSQLKGKNVVGVADEDSESDEAPSLADTTSTAANNASLRAHVIVPDQEEISRLIMKRRKENLMAKYASAGFQDSQSEAKKLLNIKTK